MTDAEQAALLAVLERNEERLRALPGVHTVDVGFEYADGEPTGRLAVRLHVHAKLPESQLESAAVAPTDVEGIPVDVLETHPELQQRDRRVDPLRGGVGTTNSTRLAGFVGTLGAVVFDRSTGAPMALSNHHVYAGPAARVGDAIAQPSSTRPRDVIGTLTRWHRELDCAVATLDGSRRISTGIIDHPAGVAALQGPRIGLRVTKSGRTTGTTFGIVDGVSRDQLTIVPDPARPAVGGEISAPGDSGSVWLRTDVPSVGVGLHYAGERDPDPAAERAWAKHLVRVAAALHIRFRQLPATPVATGSAMRPGEVLNAGQSIASPNGRFRFAYRADGNLVVLDGGRQLWSSGTPGRPAGVCVLQDDGDLVVSDPDLPLWASGTGGNPGSRLVVRDEGNVVITRPDGRAVWATRTTQRAAIASLLR